MSESDGKEPFCASKATANAAPSAKSTPASHNDQDADADGTQQRDIEGSSRLWRSSEKNDAHSLARNGSVAALAGTEFAGGWSEEEGKIMAWKLRRARAVISRRRGPVYGFRGKSHGTRSTVRSRTTIVKGTPIRSKSPKRYCPGASTSVFTGDETGVMKAAEAASATVMTKG